MYSYLNAAEEFMTKLHTINEIWCDLMGFERMPADHFAGFKNITQYRFVDQREVYRRLGYLGPVKRGKHITEGYTTPYKEMPRQLCTPAEFREKICGGDADLPSLVRKNETGVGVPQGAPISDLIANFYLMDLDVAVKNYATERGGRYMRYSDDILLIVPGGPEAASEAAEFVKAQISDCGNGLVIKEKKTCVVGFTRTDAGLSFTHISIPSHTRSLLMEAPT